MIGAGWQSGVRASTPRHAGDRVLKGKGRVATIAGPLALAVLAAVVLIAWIAGVGPGASSSGDLPNGVSRTQVKSDFEAALAAQSRALETGDQAKAGGFITGNSLLKTLAQIKRNDLVSAVQRTEFKDNSLEVLQEADPNDPSIDVAVHHTGYARVSLTRKDTGAVIRQEDVKFDSRYWLRPVDGRFTITDETTSQEPGSPPAIPWVWIGAGLVIVVLGVAGLVAWRRRRSTRTPAAGASAPVSVMAADHGEGAGAGAGEAERLPEPIWTGQGAADAGVLGIRTLGGLQLWAEGKDRADVLLASQVAGFVWLRLLVAAVLERDSRMTRDEMCEETFPGVPRASQLNRLRGRLFDIRKFPAPIAAALRTEGQSLSFALDSCRVDAVDVLDLGRRCSGTSVLPPSIRAEAETLLPLTGGRFLPMWEGIVEKVTQGRSGAAEPVEQIRDRLAAARVDILAALGSTYVAAGRADDAARALEEGLELRPDRQDIASQLVVAYRAAGRNAEADRLVTDSGLGT
jgi:DNA-binding SARP family transcriptional activator